MAFQFREHVEFCRQFFCRFESTGSIIPSSRFLARALSGPLRLHGRPARILEVGPGTGAVTRSIIRDMGPSDRLDIVEINENFAKLLERRLEADPEFQPAAERTKIFVCSLQAFDAVGRYDFIISSLPLNNFEPETVREIFEIFFRLLQPGGVLSYFEYIGVRPLRKLMSARRDRRRGSSVDGIMKGYLGQHRVGRDCVLLNFPPAWVQHLQTVPCATEAARPSAAAWNTG